MDQIQKFEEEYIISFSNRTELIQFVSKYLAHHYKEHLEFWRATARDDRKEMSLWEERIKVEVPKLEAAIKILLGEKLKNKKQFNITSKSIFLKKAFRKAHITSSSPENSFPINVEYKIDKLVFEQDVKSYRS